MSEPRHRAETFVPPEEDPRQNGSSLGDERATLLDYLRAHRETLRLKCSGLSDADLARRSVEPSTLSLLGLVRHMADVERHWFRQVMCAEDLPRRYRTESDLDGDFNGAVADPAVVADAWAAWEEEIAFADQFLSDEPDLAMVQVDPRNGPVSLREVLVHMIEEYARHNGHADLLRERIDGRVGL